jgi:hypothetical protein
LRSEGLIELRRLALDGTKKPGNAGTNTHHREPTLQRHLAEAEAAVRQWEADCAATEALTARQRAARRRAARERHARLERAVAQVQELQRRREQCKRPDARPEEARANEADPDATRMKQGDGGFRIGYNVQTVTDAACGLVVTTEVITQGNDSGQLQAQLARVQREQGRRPEELLLDSGYATLDDIRRAEADGVAVLMPPKSLAQDRAAGRDPYAPKRDDTAELARWRARMGTAVAQAVYRLRSGLAEWVHARMEQRGWHRFRLRGLAKANTEALWQAWAHNVGRLLGLGRLLPEG